MAKRNQVIASSAKQVVQNDRETNPSRISLPPGPERREVMASVLWVDGRPRGAKVQLVRNGTEVLAEGESTCSVIVDYDPADYYEVVAYQRTGRSVEVRGPAFEVRPAPDTVTAVNFDTEPLDDDSLRSDSPRHTIKSTGIYRLRDLQ